VTQAYVGYNTAGATTLVVTANRWYAKKFTIATACLLTDIEVYLKWSGDFARDIRMAIFADNAGAVGQVLQAQRLSAVLDPSESGTTSNPRWFGLAMGRWVIAADYWIGVAQTNGPNLTLYYDGSGSDVTFDIASEAIVDGNRYTQTNTTNQFSIRANTIR